MSAHALLNLLKDLRKRDKMQGLLSILSLFPKKFNEFNNTGARMSDSIYHVTLKLFSNNIFGVKTLWFCHMHDMMLKASFHNVSRKICKPLVVY